MPLTVSTLCELTNPPMTPVAGVRRLSNKISWVVSTEHLEPRNWLRGGEFMLMSGWNFATGASMERYVEHLYRAGLAGLGFGVGMRYEEIPALIVKKAEKLGFPVCLVPYELAFEAISRTAAEVLFSERQSKSLTSTVFQSRVVEEVLEGKIDLRDIATRLANTLLCDVVFTNERDGVLVGAVGRRPEIEGRLRPERTERSCSPAVTMTINRAETTLSTADKAFVDEMSFAARIAIYTADAVRRERLRLESDFLHDLATGNLTHSQVSSKLSAFGFDHTARFHVLVVRDPIQIETTAEKVRLLLGRLAVEYLKFKRETSLEVLIGRSGQLSCEELAAEIAVAVPKAAIGVSRPSTAGQLVYALRQAQYLSRIGKRGVFPPEMLGFDELIMMIDEQAASDFIRRNIGKGVDADLLVAMDMLLEWGFNINVAAKKLGIHRHTLRAKVAKFAELSNCDIRDPLQRQATWIAIRLARNIKNVGL